MPDQQQEQQHHQLPCQQRQQYYLHPSDGQLAPLVVHSFEDASWLPGTETRTWGRAGRPVSPVSSLICVSYWVWAPICMPGSKERQYSVMELGAGLVRSIAAWPLMVLLAAPTLSDMSMITRGQAQVPSDTRYDKVFTPESQGDDSTFANNPANWKPYFDDMPLDDAQNRTRLPSQPSAAERSYGQRTEPRGSALRPRFLCVVDGAGGYETVNVSDYLQQYGDDMDMEFVFVSYTRFQFRVASDPEIDAYQYPDEATREANRTLARRDRAMLLRWGADAAKKAGKRAFWLDFECVRDDDGVARASSSSDNAYRICDIVRAAHSMIVAIGPSTAEKLEAVRNNPQDDGTSGYGLSSDMVSPWLRQWGSQLWALPELLLCPGEYRIKLYVVGDEDSGPKDWDKRSFAKRAWDDAGAVKELVNHYEGSTTLSPAALFETALECLARREAGQFNQGDIAYAVMGLLPERQRPTCSPHDSGFTAFARLALASNSAAFLVRLMCIQPVGAAAGEASRWHGTHDHWGARMVDIHPVCEVSGVGDSDTIIAEGVHGAAICWESLEAIPINADKAKPLEPLVLALGLGMSLASVIIVPILVLGPRLPNITRKENSGPANELNNYLVLVFSATMVAFALILPHLVVSLRPTTHQASSRMRRILGFEGIVDPGIVEKHLTGFDHGCLTTVTGPNGGRKGTEEKGEEDGDQGQHDAAGCDEYDFTLVDTHLMTVTYVRCRSPPVAMLSCGREAGLERALICSYDHQRSAFVRETILRVPPEAVYHMHRIDRLKLSIHDESSFQSGAPGTSNDIPVAGSQDETGRSAAESSAALPKKAKSSAPESQILSLFLASVLITWMASRIDIVRPPNSRPDPRLPYFTAFLYNPCFAVGHAAAWILLSRLPLVRVLPPLAILRVRGVVDGALIVGFVGFTWSYYSTSKQNMASWLRTWAFFSPTINQIVIGYLYASDMQSKMGIFHTWGYSMVCILSGILLPQLMMASGNPQYLGAKLSATQDAARGPLSSTVSWSNGSVETLRRAAGDSRVGAWVHRLGVLADVRSYICLVASFSAAVTALHPWRPGGRSGYSFDSMDLVASISLARTWEMSGLLSVPMVSLFFMTGCFWGPIEHRRTVMDVSQMVLPLLWIQQTTQASTWRDVGKRLLFSLIGLACSPVAMFNPLEYEFAYMYVPVVGGAAMLDVLQVIDWVNKSKRPWYETLGVLPPEDEEGQ